MHHCSELNRMEISIQNYFVDTLGGAEMHGGTNPWRAGYRAVGEPGPGAGSDLCSDAMFFMRGSCAIHARVAP